eukprot:10157014-Ditylum_brightwellii.AAC.1
MFHGFSHYVTYFLTVPVEQHLQSNISRQMLPIGVRHRVPISVGCKVMHYCYVVEQLIKLRSKLSSCEA